MLSFNDFENRKEKIAVVGLGYVGMPLLFHLSKQFKTIGFDINEKRVSELNNGIDITGELSDQLTEHCKRRRGRVLTFDISFFNT